MNTPLTTASRSTGLKLVAGRLAALAVGIAEHAAAVLRNRRAARKLLDFDDRMLADIGIDRSTIQAALMDSLISDPAARLNAERRVQARHFYDEAAGR